MLEAALWGFVAASALIIAAEIALRFELRDMVIGLITAFGVGALVSAIAFELVEPALGAAGGDAWLVALALLLGAVAFFAIDLAVERLTGAGQGDEREQQQRSGLAVALGTTLDNIPETFVIGVSVASGEGIGIAFLAAVWISNFPESLISTVDLRDGGRSPRWIRRLWIAVAVLTAAASVAGFLLVGEDGALITAVVQAFAAGAILTMIMDEMAPDAFKRSYLFSGLAATAGFAVALAIGTLV